MKRLANVNFFHLLMLVVFNILIYFNIELLRPIFTTFYIFLIPGLLILTILKTRSLSTTETVIYSVGLSLASLFLIGWSINGLLPLLGIKNPLTLKYLLIGFNLYTLFLIMSNDLV